MSAADELELQQVAEDLVAEFGRVVSLVPPGSTDISDTEPWKGQTGDGTAIPVSAVFQTLRKELIPGTAVEIGDSLAIIDSKTLAGVQITTAYKLVDGSSRWSIVAPLEAKPGRSSFVWFLHIREAGT